MLLPLSVAVDTGDQTLAFFFFLDAEFFELRQREIRNAQRTITKKSMAPAKTQVVNELNHWLEADSEAISGSGLKMVPWQRSGLCLKSGDFGY